MLVTSICSSDSGTERPCWEFFFAKNKIIRPKNYGLPKKFETKIILLLLLPPNANALYNVSSCNIYSWFFLNPVYIHFVFLNTYWNDRTLKAEGEHIWRKKTCADLMEEFNARMPALKSSTGMCPYKKKKGETKGMHA